jgi:hypothetical protein
VIGIKKPFSLVLCGRSDSKSLAFDLFLLDRIAAPNLRIDSDYKKRLSNNSRTLVPSLMPVNGFLTLYATDYGGGGAVPTRGDYSMVQQALCTGSKCNGCLPNHGNRHSNPGAVTATILGR